MHAPNQSSSYQTPVNSLPKPLPFYNKSKMETGSKSLKYNNADPNQSKGFT
jgi:hypothetical protein